MIRIEVQQDSNAESAAWVIEGPWDFEAAWVVINEIEKAVKSCDGLGISLWDVMSKRLSASQLDFELVSKPRFMRCAAIPVRFAPPAESQERT